MTVLRGPRITRVFLDRLCVDARIGINPDEADKPQAVRIDVSLEVVPGRPPDSGALVPLHATDARTRSVVCYGALAEAVREAAGGRHWDLAEDLAESIAGICLGDRRVRRAVIRIGKPDAVAGAADAGVEIEVERGNGIADGD